MTPISPDDHSIPEDEIINVTGEDGVTRQFQRRHMGVVHFKNHKLSNDFVSGTLRVVSLIKAIIALVTAVCGGWWAINELVIVPKQERMIERVIDERLKPVEERALARDKAFNDHLLNDANLRASYPTRVELKEDLDELKDLILETRK